jgi:hypothetical protein
MAPAVAGDIAPLEPSILHRTDGQSVIYPGLLHWMMGEPGKGKTWVALAAVAELLAHNLHVMVLDWEGNRRIIGHRLAALGVTPTQAARLHYWRPDRLDIPTVATIAQTAAECALVVCDGVAKALAHQGLDEDRAADVLTWLHLLADPVCDVGAAMLCLDHVVKANDTRGLWARGSGAKLGEVSGAAWLLKTGVPFSRHRAGHATLVQAKDREGWIAADGDPIARVTFTPHDDGHLDVTLDPPDPQRAEAGEWDGPTECMAAIRTLFAEHLPEGERLSKRNAGSQLRARGLNYRDSTVADALERLAVAGDLEKFGGPRRSHLFGLPADGGQATLDNIEKF